MDFKNYKNVFGSLCREKEYDESVIIKLLDYAERLNSQNLPIIYNIDHLSQTLNIETRYIERFLSSNKRTKYYYTFKVPKKNNRGIRIISEPVPNLKYIQYWILNNILNKIDVHSSATAYVRKKNIYENVKVHRDKKIVFKVDIENFFGSINSKNIFNIFNNLGYSVKISEVLTEICLLENSLPQGAPTSAYLSNIHLFEFDKIISDYCTSNNIQYTRYSDDLTFSGDFNHSELKCFVVDELSKLNLNVNNKTKVMNSHQKQYVTGVVVNKVIQLSKEERNNFRHILYIFKKENGIENYLKFYKVSQTKKNSFLRSILGKVYFGLYLNSNDKVLIELKKMLKKYIKKN